MSSDIWADMFRSIQKVFAAVGDPDAVTADYETSEGSTRSCPVMFDKGLLLQPGGFTSAVSAQGITIEAALEDLGKNPERDETFTVGSTIYTVLAVQENDGHIVKVQVTL